MLCRLGSRANATQTKVQKAPQQCLQSYKYFNNIVEQDPRGVKRVTRAMLGFKAFEAAQDTLVGITHAHDQETAAGG